jgi:hypothetical protein
VPTGKGSVRVFLKNSEINIKFRNNQLYDEHIRILSQVTIILLKKTEYYLFIQSEKIKTQIKCKRCCLWSKGSVYFA